MCEEAWGARVGDLGGVGRLMYFGGEPMVKDDLRLEAECEGKCCKSIRPGSKTDGDEDGEEEVARERTGAVYVVPTMAT